MTYSITRAKWNSVLDEGMHHLEDLTDWLHGPAAAKWLSRWVHNQLAASTLPQLFNHDDLPASEDEISNHILDIMRTVSDNSIVWALDRRTRQEMNHPGSVKWHQVKGMANMAIPGSGVIMPIEGALADTGMDIVTWHSNTRAMPPTGGEPGEEDAITPVVFMGWSVHTASCPPVPTRLQILDVDAAWLAMHDAGDMTDLVARLWEHYLNSPIAITIYDAPEYFGNRRVTVLE